jgi:hypothetical protein
VYTAKPDDTCVLNASGDSLIKTSSAINLTSCSYDQVQVAGYPKNKPTGNLTCTPNLSLAVCDWSCTPNPTCPDGVVNQPLEQCDGTALATAASRPATFNTKYPSPVASNWDCTNQCTLLYCGDGIKNRVDEECDGSDGVGAGQRCSDTCKLERVAPLPTCPDGVVNQPSEQCDGTALAPTASRPATFNGKYPNPVASNWDCTNACKLRYCGDGIVNRSDEECDESDGVGAGQSCSANCKLITYPTPTAISDPPACNDGVVNQRSEQCDKTALAGTTGRPAAFNLKYPNPASSNWDCTNECKLLFCGDGIKNRTNEECDGSAGVGVGQICSADCKLERIPPAPECGDGVVNRSKEECDTFALASVSQRPPEFNTKYPSPSASDWSCSTECLLEYCGDSAKNRSEECDGRDGILPGETCGADCKKVQPIVVIPTPPPTPTPHCGNGVLDPGEECDPKLPGSCGGCGCVNCKKDCNVTCRAVWTTTCKAEKSSLTMKWGPGMKITIDGVETDCSSDPSCCPHGGGAFTSQKTENQCYDKGRLENTDRNDFYVLGTSCPVGTLGGFEANAVFELTPDGKNFRLPPTYKISCSCAVADSTQTTSFCVNSKTGVKGADDNDFTRP